MTHKDTVDNDVACPHYRGDLDTECVLPRGHGGLHKNRGEVGIVTDINSKKSKPALTEYEALDAIFEALPDNFPVSIYPVHSDMPRPEMYIRVNGQCWRVFAEPHPHPVEEKQ